MKFQGFVYTVALVVAFFGSLVISGLLDRDREAVKRAIVYGLTALLPLVFAWIVEFLSTFSVN